jgi:hypothetical protein
MGFGRQRIVSKRLLDPRQGAPMVAALAGDHADEVQCAGVGGLGR